MPRSSLPTRADAAATSTARRPKIHAAGVVDRWLVLGPFDNEGKEGLDHAFAPEQEFGEAIDLMRPYQGKERPARWRAAPDVYRFGWLDLGDLVRPREKVCVYATTFVRAKDGGARAASVWAGASGSFKLFWNGDEVLTDSAYRSLDAESVLGARHGWPKDGTASRPRYAVTTTARCCRCASPIARGPPTRDSSFRPTLAHSPEAAKNVAVHKTKTAGPKIGGPIPAFEAMTQGSKSPPEKLEAYARYLQTTGGDDAALHVAQDLARRAAKAGPRSRAICSRPSSADDRNEKREWLDPRARASWEEGARPSSCSWPSRARAHRHQLARRDPVLRRGARRRSRATSEVCSGASSSTAKRVSSTPRTSLSKRRSRRTRALSRSCASTPPCSAT